MGNEIIKKEDAVVKSTLIEEMPEITDIKTVSTARKTLTPEVLNYLRQLTGIPFDTIYDDGESESLLPINLKRGHVLCVSVIESNYASVKANVVEFENQDLVNYVIGYNYGDAQLGLGKIIQFGSNVVPLEIVYTKNINDVEQIKTRINDNKQIIVDSTWFNSKEGAKAAVKAKEDGTSIADKYLLASDPVKMVKIMSYNMSLISGISPFTKRNEIELFTRLR
jgi:hypothetical protein